jgi:hypothetical protein
MTGTHQHVQLCSVEIGPCKLFFAWLEPNLSDFSLLYSWDDKSVPSCPAVGWDGFHELFAWADFEVQSFWFYPSM